MMNSIVAVPLGVKRPIKWLILVQLEAKGVTAECAAVESLSGRVVPGQR